MIAKTIKAFVVNPKTQSILPTLIDGECGSITKAIGAKIFDVISLNHDKTGNAFDFYIDDEGLFNADEDGNVHVSLFEGWQEPICGTFLVTGVDLSEGTTISVPEEVTPEYLISKLKCGKMKAAA